MFFALVAPDFAVFTAVFAFFRIVALVATAVFAFFAAVFALRTAAGTPAEPFFAFFMMIDSLTYHLLVKSFVEMKAVTHCIP